MDEIKKEENKKRCKLYRQKNLDERRTYDREYAKNHRAQRAATRKIWYEKNKEKVIRTQHKYYRDNINHYRQFAISRIAKLRREALMNYSNGKMCCACCGENIEAFLTLDHINQDGAAHRRRLGTGNVKGRREGSGSSFYYKIKRDGYPAGLRVLCYNCNCGK